MSRPCFHCAEALDWEYAVALGNFDWEACCDSAQHSSGGEAASLSETAGQASAALPTLQGPTLAERFR